MGLPIPHLEHLESRASRVLAVVLSAALHVGLFILLLSYGGQYDGIDGGETPITRLVMLESRNADRRDGIELPPREIPVPQINVPEPALAQSEPPAQLLGALHPEPEPAPVVPPAELSVATDPVSTDVIDAPATIDVPEVDTATFVRHLEHLAENLVKTSRAPVYYTQVGTVFRPRRAA